MELNTKHFGLIEIEEKGIIQFTDGLPGFENLKQFVLLGSPDKDSPFQWLQSLDNTDIAFVVIDPRVFKPDYDIDVDDSEVEILRIKDVKNVLVYSIVVIPDDISKMTANLKAPILINIENNMAKQIVLDKSTYQVRHYILDELRKIGG
ncbi:MAG: flagellar assembly protein FliW [Clostridia bacterium]|nr:flagellar assembly protein FliW [Clostridia bacterium]